MTPTLKPEVRPDTAVVATPPKKSAPLSPVACTQCGGYHTTRSHRRTFFQRQVLFRLGFFPWKCVDCAHRFLSRQRGYN